MMANFPACDYHTTHLTVPSLAKQLLRVYTTF